MTMSKSKKRKTILALFPNTVGICYAVFQGSELIDYGIGYVRPVNNQKSLKKVKRYLDFHNPDVVLIRELSKPKAILNQRNDKLIQSICELINSKQKIELQTYNRDVIQETMSLYEVYSKYQIMQKLIFWFPQLESYEYPHREDWMNENHNTGLFSAVSLAVVYMHQNEYYYGDKS